MERQGQASHDPIAPFNEQRFILMTPQISAVPDHVSSKPIGTLEHCRYQVLAAMDFTITGFG